MNWNSARLVAAAFGIGIGLAGCTKRQEQSASGPPQLPPVPVGVATAVRGDLPIIIRAIGSAQSKATVMLRPQIEGRIASLLVEEGTDVLEGQLILKIDNRQLEAALRQAEASLARSRALATNARYVAARNRDALASNAASPAELEASEAQEAAANAEIKAAEAEVETARLNLAYCNVNAPFPGRLGQLLVKPGSIVKANETDLVEIAEIDPIEVAFSIPEQQIFAVRDAYHKDPLVVKALPSGDTADPVQGTLSFVDNRVDVSTGTIKLKATFPNTVRRLWPGQFVNISLILGSDVNCVLIPDQAIQMLQRGPSVFIVKPDQTVDLRTVTVRRTIDGQSIIDAGIDAGEVVVTDGQLRLAPGSKVQVKVAEMKAGSGSGSGGVAR